MIWELHRWRRLGHGGARSLFEPGRASPAEPDARPLGYHETLPAAPGVPSTVPSATTRTCVRCIMDTSDPDLRLDGAGVCRYCRFADRILPKVQPSPEESKKKLEALAAKIRRAGEGHEYDSVIGLSGGVDSSYTAYLAHRARAAPAGRALRQRLELRARGREHPADRRAPAGSTCITYVIDWREFRDLQRAFLQASVVDIELLTDHAIFAATLSLAREHGIRYILSGNNVATEHGLPPAWIWNKQDWTNIRAIHEAYGSVPAQVVPASHRRRGGGSSSCSAATSRSSSRSTSSATAETRPPRRSTRESRLARVRRQAPRVAVHEVLPGRDPADRSSASISVASTCRIGSGTASSPARRPSTIVESPPYAPAELAREREYVLQEARVHRRGVCDDHGDAASVARRLPLGPTLDRPVRNLYRPIRRLRAAF